MRKKRKKIILGLKIFFGFLVMFIVSLSALFLYYAKDLPRPEVFTERPFVLPTKIYDRTGKILLYQIYGEEKRIIVSLEEVPRYLKYAVLAAEDANFYHHIGIDVKGILRAFFQDIKMGRFLYGGSTISQQLIRSSFLTREKSIKRKIKEIILTLELERRYSKDKILEFYLNQVPLGNNCYGVGCAAQVYFKKNVSDLSLAECALLASLIKAPSYLSPYGPHQKELLERKDYILERMVKLGFISKKEAEEAKKEKLNFSKIKNPIKAPHFVLYVKQYLESHYPEEFLKTKGLKVITTLDWNLQQLAEKILKEKGEENKKYNAFNGALVALDPKTGEILTMVGSLDYFQQPYPKNCTPGKNCLFEPKVNIAVYGKGRQPGSAFKPFVYAKAFEKGFTPKTIVWDVETEFNPYCSLFEKKEKDKFGRKCYHPQNYNKKFKGPVTLKEALAQSINVPAVKVMYLAGVEDTINLAKKMGIKTLTKKPSWYGLSLVLGGGEVKLLDMVEAYSVFANDGLKVKITPIKKIIDKDGNIIEQHQPSFKRILKENIAREINDILSDNEARAPMFGYDSVLNIKDYQVAVKTGTTQNYRDAWTIGYTNSLVVGVWVGNNDGTPTTKPGVVLAGPIWNEFIKKALKFYPPQPFTPPVLDFKNIKKGILKGEIDLENPHCILYYIDKNNPLGEKPKFPETDPQYFNWELGVKLWVLKNLKQNL